ncbi:MAG TPA: TadE family protein [Bryobacteraceae bacterium]|nr:TadE family protein [Bryobacteraceae bacterium]
MSQKPNRASERGSAMIEFLLSSLIWLPLLLGTIVFGINLIRAIQVSQLARDSGHMYAKGIDFSQNENTPLLARMAANLSIKGAASDPGAIVLSQVTYVTDKDCDACANLHQYVFTSLYVFGNAAYGVTKLGNPIGYYNQTLTSDEYLTKTALRAPNFPDILAHDQPGQTAFVSEVTVNSQAISWTDFSNTGSYARSIF